VDVLASAWVLTGLSTNLLMQEVGAQKVAHINAISMKAIAALRQEPKIGMKAILTLLAHPSGTIHMKLVVIGTPTMAKAFTGGIELVSNRFAEIGHVGRINSWHDMSLLVEGEGGRAIYQHYRDIWNESVIRPPETFKLANIELASHQTKEPGNTPLVPEFHEVSAGGPYRIQSLRTIPQFHFASFNTLPSPPPVSFAPDGLFEFKAGLKKAISGARRYIYIEDQSFLSVQIMSWVHDAIVQNNQLRVILHTGGADPADPESPRGYLARAINVGLLRGGNFLLPELEPGQRDRVRLFKRSDDELFGAGAITAVTTEGDLRRVTLDLIASGLAIPKDALRGSQIRVGTNVFPIVKHERIGVNEHLVLDVQPGPVDIFTPAGVVPVVGPMELWKLNTVIVHAKLVMIDDNVMICGSANIMRRSLYTEFEHSVSVVDPADALVRDTRGRVWADHFRHPTPADFADIAASLNAWVPGWGTAGAAPARRPHIMSVPIPIIAPILTDDQIELYDAYLDFDSRQEWGGFCPATPSEEVEEDDGS
jgi:phosphatidylserine/phosphatidylglycerophosphate/cardiolipin synthase-like enzyme